MSKFAHLKALKVDGTKTVRYELSEITVNGVSPVLLVAPATDANKPYFNAMLKRVAATKKRPRGGAITMAFIDESREEDIQTYAEHIIKGWEDMIGADGKPIKFSVDECKEFLEAIDTWIFDGIRAFCVDPKNFAGDLDINIEDVSKN